VSLTIQKQVVSPNIAQKEALEAFDSWEGNKGVMILPTGTGKTILSALVVKKIGGRILFVAHTNEILNQTKKEFEKVLGKVPISFYNAKTKDVGVVTFATVQTLGKNLKKFSEEQFELIVFDEVHHYQAKSYKKVVKYFKPKFLLGLTATPYRTDNKDIFDLCGKPIYKMSIQKAKELGLLCNLNYYAVDNDIDFSKIFWNGRRYDKNDLNRALCIPEYDNAIFDEWTKSCVGLKTIAFCSTVEHTKRLEKVFCERGVRACSLTGKVKASVRDEIVAGFKDGKFEIIFVRDLFNEGVDVPNTEAILFLRPTYSSIIFTQQLGRGLRVAEGKKGLLVLDFAGNARKASLNFKVLNEVFGEGLLKKVRESIRRGQKEIVVEHYGDSIRFNKHMVDVIKQKFFVKEDFINDYWRVRKKIGHNLTGLEYDKFGKYSFDTIRRRFGSWNKFKKEIGETLQSKYDIPKEVFIKDYRNVKKQKGYSLTQNEYNKFGKYSSNWIIPRFGSWNKFKKEMGEETITHLRCSKEDFINDYWRVRKKLGHSLLIAEYHKYGNHSYACAYYIFSSWNKFKKEIGEESINQAGSPISKEDFINDYWRVKKKLGHSLSLSEYKKYGKYSKGYIQRKLRNWTNFKKEIGETLLDIPKIPKEDLIEDYWKARKERGHSLSRNEYKKYGNYCCVSFSNRFGSWTNFKKEIGETLFNNYKISKEDFVKDYWRVRKKIGYSLKIREYRKQGKYSPHVSKRLFGSWNKFKKEIGEKQITQDRYLINPNLVIIDKYSAKNKLSSEKLVEDSSTIRKEVKKSGLAEIKKSGKKHNFGEKKDELRTNILKKIRNGDSVLLLESPECYAIKEMIELGLKPKKVIIPNHQEFNQLVQALKKIKLPFKVEVIKTSVLQIIADTDEKIDFAWLDYYGAFVNYSKDMRLLLKRGILNDGARVLGTYRILDFRKANESHYFANAIDFIIQECQELNQKIRILSDVSCRYKSTMYNVGFQLTGGLG